MFGSFIRHRREELDLSLRHVARLMGVSPTYLSKMERDKEEVGTFTEKRCRSLARILELDPDKLVLLAGRIPSDIHLRLCQHPELIDEIRERSA